MSNLPANIAQGQVALPAHLQALVQQGQAPRSMAVAGEYLRYIALKNGQFVIEENGVAMALPSPLRCVILAFQPAIGRVFYKNEYVPGVKNVMPACWSVDGRAPVPHAPERQSTLCQVCPQNEKNSARNGRGKACSYSRRVVVWVPGYDEAFVIKMGGISSFSKDNPQQGRFNFESYGKMLSGMGVDPSWVWTQLQFDPAQTVAALHAGFGVGADGQPYVDADTLAYLMDLRQRHDQEITDAVSGDFRLAGTANDNPQGTDTNQFPASQAPVSMGHPAAQYAGGPQVLQPQPQQPAQQPPMMPAQGVAPQTPGQAALAALQPQQGGQFAPAPGQPQPQLPGGAHAVPPQVQPPVQQPVQQPQFQPPQFQQPVQPDPAAALPDAHPNMVPPQAPQNSPVPAQSQMAPAAQALTPAPAAPIPAAVQQAQPVVQQAGEQPIPAQFQPAPAPAAQAPAPAAQAPAPAPAADAPVAPAAGNIADIMGRLQGLTPNM
ncbi:MAG: hypothetical protein DI640_12955 [Sphingomonas taxi]|uniref:Uncharacterized protein n=1 Tax=Sphingomonas taxi TaxID=1549858 RepID=A0A2W5AVX7_9SPHN|nr:MAG: hypothetical protein DI640_12955 [Sphingomonas taxi]